MPRPREGNREDFLVQSGECLLLVEGQERPLTGSEFVRCPAGTEHIFVGAGEGPWVIFMAGARWRPGPPANWDGLPWDE
jgi:quercetin dioxygenase-like cupin family protein